MIIALIALPAVAVMLAMLARVETSLTAAARTRPEPVRPVVEPVVVEPGHARAA
jgi:hypothetical protein